MGKAGGLSPTASPHPHPPLPQSHSHTHTPATHTHCFFRIAWSISTATEVWLFFVFLMCVCVCAFPRACVCRPACILVIFLCLCTQCEFNCPRACMCPCVCVCSPLIFLWPRSCVCVWRKAQWRGGRSFTMVNWKEPFFYSAINPIWVNNTLLCSRAVTVICRALNLRALQTAAGHPNDDKMLQKPLFTKYIMQSIVFHCTVLEKQGIP